MNKCPKCGTTLIPYAYEFICSDCGFRVTEENEESSNAFASYSSECEYLAKKKDKSKYYL